MKTLVHLLSTTVRRFPWVIIAVTLIVTLVLGGFGARFQPGEDRNESFAPAAPEIAAQSAIQERFDGDGGGRTLQVVVTAADGDVLDLDGLAAVAAIKEAVLDSELASYLVEDPEQPPIVGFLTPVERAMAMGAPPPRDDAAVKDLYRLALDRMPPEQAALLDRLLPAAADHQELTAPSGLVIVLTRGPDGVEGFDDFVEAVRSAADAIGSADLPDTVTAEPFSFELLFGDESEFESEIGRLFATAGFIIFLVLTIIFLVRAHRPRTRVLSVVGLVALTAAVGVLVLPGLAALFPDLLPSAVAEWETGPLLLLAAATFAVVYVVWALFTRALRRTTADTLVTLVTIMVAISWMNGYGYLRFGEQGPMVQILPILLIGLGVDYAIHVTTRYREEVGGGASVDTAVGTAIRTVGIALVLATVTTAVGFLTNLTSDIPALRQFGELAAMGIAASFLLMLTFVPAVRELLDRRGEARGTLDRERLRGGEAKRLPRLIGRTAWLPRRAAAATVVASLVLGVLGAWGTTQVKAEFSFLDFVPVDSPLRGTFETILRDYGGGFGETTQVLVEGDVATPAAWNALVGATGNLRDTEGVVQAGEFPAAESPVSLLGELADPTSPRFDPAVGRAAAAAGMSPGSPLVRADADVAGLYDAMVAAAPEDAAAVLHRGEAGYDSALFTITTQAGEKGAGRLAVDLAEDFSPVEAAGLSAVATSNEIISNVVVTTLQASQLSSLLLTLVAALLLLVANFWFESRRPMLGVLTTLPVVLVVFWSFGLMALFGIPFGPVTATISALAIGIGVPYMIHVTHRYLEDRARQADENEAVSETLTHTGGALAGSALTTIAGFGILVTSTTIPFRQFGFVTAYTILLALLGAVLVLPSFLVVWDRWHRRRGEDPVDREALALALEDEALVVPRSAGP